MTKEMKNVVAGIVVVDERNETLWTVEEKSGKFKTIMMHNRIDKAEVVTVTYTTFKKHFTVLTSIDTLKVEEPEVAEEEIIEIVKTEKVVRKERKKRGKVDIWAIIDPIITKYATFKTFEKGRSVYVANIKIFELWERNTCVRMYIKKDFIDCINKELVERITPKPQDPKYVSLYIPANNIETVLNMIFV